MRYYFYIFAIVNLFFIAGFAAAQSATGASKNIAPGRPQIDADAVDCVNIERIRTPGDRFAAQYFSNGCDYDISIAWCAIDGHYEKWDGTLAPLESTQCDSSTIPSPQFGSYATRHNVLFAIVGSGNPELLNVNRFSTQLARGDIYYAACRYRAASAPVNTIKVGVQIYQWPLRNDPDLDNEARIYPWIYRNDENKVVYSCQNHEFNAAAQRLDSQIELPLELAPFTTDDETADS